MEELNLRFDPRKWLTSYGKLNTEQGTLNFYRNTYKGEIPRKDLEPHLISLEAWHSFAYQNRLLFDFTVYDRFDHPWASVLLNDGNAIVHYLDEYQRPYMVYTFGGEYRKGYLFLESLHYFEYEGEEFKERDESIADTEYRFQPNGQLVIYKEYTKEDGHRYESEQAAAHPVNVSSNWEPYPPFNQYVSLVRMKRWAEGELLKGIPSLN
jgi:hypothetical protein